MNLNQCHNFQDFRKLARKRLPSPIFNYIDGAADDEVTYQRNTKSYEEVDLILNELVNTQVELDATSTDRVSTDNSTRDIKEFETSAKDDRERVGGSK